MKCKNCGAELKNGKCEYCGSQFGEIDEPEIHISLEVDPEVIHRAISRRIERERRYCTKN